MTRIVAASTTDQYISSNCACDMNEYLKSTVEKLSCGNYATLHAVLGNESCDLDSAVCALVYGAFRAWQHLQMQCKVCTRNKRTEEVKDDIFVPILNVNRDEYEIKTEVAYVFKSHGIDKENLVFKDDPILPKQLLNSNITLVDHHVLSTSDQHLAPLVSEVIDHRPIDKSGWNYRQDTRSTIELVGSCATLVAQRIMDLSALFAKDVDFFMANMACCDMLHSTIILDTVNCSKQLNKATPHDEEVLLFLEGILNTEDAVAERAHKLSTLVRARRDVSELSPPQLLKKDTKIVQDVVVPSLPLLVKEFLSRSGAVPAVAGAGCSPGGAGCSPGGAGCSPGGVVVLLGMELAGTGGLRRDMAVYTTQHDRRDRLCAFLQAWTPSLDLSEEQLPDESSDLSLRYFVQGNLSASRKQYMPALQAFLELNDS